MTKRNVHFLRYRFYLIVVLGAILSMVVAQEAGCPLALSKVQGSNPGYDLMSDLVRIYVYGFQTSRMIDHLTNNTHG